MRQALKLTSAGVGAFALYKAQSSSAPQPKCLAAKRDGVLAFGAAPAGAVGGPFGNPAHDWDYYQKCMVGGILSCGLTHLAVTPLDVTKCRMQTQPELYKGISQGFSLVPKDGALFLGWLPTLLGYSAQGFFKFGFYEIFKDLYSSWVGAEAAYNYRTYVYLTASASAEVIADVALAPFEAVKVRIQTSLPSANFPTSFFPAFSKVAEKGTGEFFKGIYPLWGRQVPYTMVKFSCFEKTVEAFYTYVFTNPKSSYSKTTNLSITFASGYIAGVLCAVVSQPADTLVSKLNQSPGAALGEVIAKAGGIGGLYKGLGMRIIMVGTLTGLQWWIYDAFKTATGIVAAAPVKK